MALGAFAGGLGWRLQGDLQVASATLQVTGAGASVDPSLAESHMRLAASAAVLSRVVAQENLAADSEIMPAPLGSLDGVLAAAGLISPTGEARAAAAVRGLSERLSVARDGAPDLIQLSVRASTPEKAALLANAVAGASVAERLEARSEANRLAAQRDATRLAALQTRLYEAETKLIAARQQGGLAADPKAELAQAKARLAEARQRHEQAQRAAAGQGAEAGADAVRTPAMDRLQARLAEATRVEAGYRQTLGPRHPLMVDAQQQLRDARRALADEVKRAVEASRAELQAAEAAEAAAALRANSAAASTDAGAAKLRALETEAETTRAAYEKMLRARAGAGADEQDASAGVRLLAPASSATAVPAASLAAFLAAGAGIGLALGALAGLLGAWRNGAERRAGATDLAGSPPKEQVQDLAGTGASPARGEALPAPAYAVTVTADRTARTLGPAPAVPVNPPDPPDAFDAWSMQHESVEAADLSSERHSDAADADPAEAPGLTEARDRPESAYAQNVAAMAEAVLAESRADGRESGAPYTVLVTSLAPQAGKSTLAANLARALAGDWRRILLVDAHRRNPTLSLAFGLGGQPGLLRIGGRDRPVHALDGDWAQGVFFLPVDTARNGRPAKLPEGARRRFDGVVGEFDIVIIDGPPAGTEATDAALAASADRVLLVSPPDQQADPAWASALLAVPREKVRELPMAA
ncbi:hypothetical protein ABEG18_26250 [Alsobacter sp. KACC 23698]|uniref:Polysaccharide biosynthesis tyrosine autokinase n=1 Tax=Alsobacter sp. KACC 23698 TaxID=3149229 RepID=A0AAU7JGF2_9HYPH